MQTNAPSELTIRIKSEEAVKGCGEVVVQLKLVDAKQELVGTFPKSGLARKLMRRKLRLSGLARSPLFGRPADCCAEFRARVVCAPGW